MALPFWNVTSVAGYSGAVVSCPTCGVMPVDSPATRVLASIFTHSPKLVPTAQYEPPHQAPIGVPSGPAPHATVVGTTAATASRAATITDAPRMSLLRPCVRVTAQTLLTAQQKTHEFV